ncbi:MAG: cytochrome c biogenesis protein ResB [Desulfuromonadaceae bacterium]
MNKVNQFITARRVSLGLILLLAALMYVSTLIPQEIDSTPAKIETWRQAHARLVWLVDGVNLHRIYAQPWFAAVILFASLALGVSSFEQLTVARRKLFSTGIGAAEVVAESVTEQHVCIVADSHRYRPLRTLSHDQLKFIRNPWGYFGVLALHIGMTLVLIVSLYVSLTGRQGALILIEGESRDNQQPLDASEHGVLSSPLKLPGSIRLDKVRVNFDSKNQPVDVSSNMLITGQAGMAESFTASVNRISRYHGLRVYHASQYGDAFTVTFIDKSGVSHTEKIMVQQSVGLTKAGYSDDFSVAWSPYLFDAKYFADVDKKSMLSPNPELVIRILDGKREMSRTSLTKGIPGELGEYRVLFNRVEKWSKLIIVDISGMSAIFAGFAIIMLGGLIHYMTPPRELIGVRQSDGSCRVYWKAVAFKEFYADERDDIARELNRETTS